MGIHTKIDWCHSTWNPVTGCLHGCEYCYARRIAERFGGYDCCTKINEAALINDRSLESPELMETWENLIFQRWSKKDENGAPTADARLIDAPYPFGFTPTLHRRKLDEPQHWKKPRTIFVCSMADLFGEWVPEAWIQEVFDACDKAPQHRYLFLTKNPKRLQSMYNARIIMEWNAEYPDKPHPQTEQFAAYTPLPERENWWWGSTLDNKNARRFQGGFYDNNFVSIEPLTEYMNVGLGSFGDCEWIIIGAETGNRKDKVIPEKSWIKNIEDAAHLTGASIFMKESLRDIMGDDFVQEFPWEVR